MKAERFTLDTNTPVYAVDCSAGLRQAVAREINRLALRRDCWLKLQAVRAFYAVATRKVRRPMYDAAGQANDWPALFPALTYSSGAVQSALASAGRLACWDALLVAKPRRAAG